MKTLDRRRKAIRAASRELIKRGHRVYLVLDERMITAGCDLYYESGTCDDRGALVMVESDQVDHERLKRFRNYDGAPHGKELVVRIFGDHPNDPGRFIPFRFDGDRVISMGSWSLDQILSRVRNKEHGSRKETAAISDIEAPKTK